MPLKQASLDVEVDLVGHVFYDVADALAGQRSLLAALNGQLVQLIELGEGRLQATTGRVGANISGLLAVLVKGG